MLKMKPFFLLILILLIFACSVFPQRRVDESASPASIQLDRERGLNMLDEIKDLIKQKYYDKKFHGINLDERFKITRERIKTLNTNSQIFRAIAQVILEFNDSHTRFFPPSRANRVEYGFSMQMIGDKCFITSVKKGSDAESKGVKVGDQIVGIGDYNPTRKNLWVINYLIYALSPQPGLTLKLLNSDNSKKELDIYSTFKSIEGRRKEAEKRRKEKEQAPYICKPVNNEAIACKLYTFSVDKSYINKMMNEVKGNKKLVLDLRGNGGGYVDTEVYLTGHFFDRNVKIGDFVTRDKTKERIAKPQKEREYTGELIVLIDSNSASAAEVFARVIQIEKRGIIVGDVSAGAVMTSNFMTMTNSRGVSGYETFSVYGMNITIADLIMSDGQRLEKIGVVPDHPVSPSGKALFEKSDPVLSYSFKLMGTELSAENAGKFYFLSSKAEDEDEETNEDK